MVKTRGIRVHWTSKKESVLVGLLIDWVPISRSGDAYDPGQSDTLFSSRGSQNVSILVDMP